MSIGAQISSGYLTMIDLDNIAQEIVSLSNKHAMKVVWKASVKRTQVGVQHIITAKVIEKNAVVWKETYTDKAWHINLALMYAGVHGFLSKKDIEFRQWMQKMMKEKEEAEREAKIARMPSWGDKLNSQM